MITTINEWKKYKILNELVETIDDLKLSKIINDTIKDGQDSDQILDHLKSFMKIFNALPNKVKLYRIIPKSVETINENDLGRHYILNPNFSEEFLDSIGLGKIIGLDLIIYEIEIQKSDINLFRSLQQNIQYPLENEIYVNRGANIKILKKYLH